MEKTFAVLSGGGPVDFVTGKLNELQARQTDLQHRLKAKDSEYQEFLSRESRLYRSKEDIKQLVEQLQSPPTDELFKIRAQIASKLKALVESLIIAPQGDRPKMLKKIAYMKENEGVYDDVIAHMTRMAEHVDQLRRYFAVGFRDSKVRLVFPTEADPLQYTQQLLGQNGSLRETSLEFE